MLSRLDVETVILAMADIVHENRELRAACKELAAENRELRKDMAESLRESEKFNKELLGYALCTCVLKG